MSWTLAKEFKDSVKQNENSAKEQRGEYYRIISQTMETLQMAGREEEEGADNWRKELEKTLVMV